MSTLNKLIGIGLIVSIVAVWMVYLIPFIWSSFMVWSPMVILAAIILVIAFGISIALIGVAVMFILDD